MRRYAACIVVLICLFGLAGCNGFHLHNPEDYKAAQEAQTSFNEAKLDELIVAEKKLNQETFDRLIAAVRRHTLARRNAQLVSMLDNNQGTPDKKDGNSRRFNTSWKYIQDNIKKRFKELGVDQNKGPKINAIFKKYELEQKKLTLVESACKGNEDDEPCKCRLKLQEAATKEAFKKLETLLNGDIMKSELGKLYFKMTKRKEDRIKTQNAIKMWQEEYTIAKSAFKSATASSDAIKESVEAFDMLQSTENVIALYQEWEQAKEEEKESKEKSLKEAVSALEAIVGNAEIEANQKTGKKLIEDAKKLPGDAVAFKALQEKVKSESEAALKKCPKACFWSLRKWLLKIPRVGEGENNEEGGSDNLPDKLGLTAKIEVLQAKLDVVNTMLEAFISPAAEPENENGNTTLIKVARTLGHLADLHTELKTYTTASGLLLESERLRIELEAAKQQSARDDIELSLWEQKLAFMQQEIKSLHKAQQKLKTLKRELKEKNQKLPKENQEKNDWGKWQKSISQDYASGDKEIQWLIVKLLYYYMESWTIGRVGQHEIDYKLIALKHEAGLDLSASALKQWNNLIIIPLSSYVRYQGSGVKSEEVGDLLHAIGLGAIAFEL